MLHVFKACLTSCSAMRSHSGMKGFCCKTGGRKSGDVAFKSDWRSVGGVISEQPSARRYLNNPTMT